MVDRRFEHSMMEPFNDWIELQTAVRVTDVFREIVDQMQHDYPSYTHSAPDDPDSCQCTALRVYEALDHFIRARGGDVQAVLAIMRDTKQNRCGNCLRREKQASQPVDGGGRLISEVKAGG